ncbi:helix-turn-helix domain-containing protein [Sphingomonas sanguinis]|uniref:helix-turn-helix domain-containing protein n=1 Tax=Sphingomonas sp. LC-1 TaxID=3110957 RepID=UPI0021BB6089|nr:helix-turn-helix domain-containing protein [Sphingomonas sp. LC-1]MCT8003282.1 helix-turn-helix domain-containing protein [Sphingomonas sp. LC-1]
MSDAQPMSETDLLYGVDQIAEHLKMTRRQVYHLHDQGHLPTFKIGGKVCARRSTLAKHFAAQEAAQKVGKE